MSASVCVKESIRKINPSRWSRLVYVVGIKRKNNSGLVIRKFMLLFSRSDLLYRFQIAWVWNSAEPLSSYVKVTKYLWDSIYYMWNKDDNIHFMALWRGHINIVESVHINYLEQWLSQSMCLLSFYYYYVIYDMTEKRWLIPNFQKELFIVKQEMALQNVYLCFFFFNTRSVLGDLCLFWLIYSLTSIF